MVLYAKKILLKLAVTNVNESVQKDYWVMFFLHNSSNTKDGQMCSWVTKLQKTNKTTHQM